MLILLLSLCLLQVFISRKSENHIFYKETLNLSEIEASH